MASCVCFGLHCASGVQPPSPTVTGDSGFRRWTAFLCVISAAMLSDSPRNPKARDAEWWANLLATTRTALGKNSIIGSERKHGIWALSMPGGFASASADRSVLVPVRTGARAQVMGSGKVVRPKDRIQEHGESQLLLTPCDALVFVFVVHCSAFLVHRHIQNQCSVSDHACRIRSFPNFHGSLTQCRIRSQTRL